MVAQGHKETALEQKAGAQKHVLAVASGGGHWVQLLRLRPAWDGCRITYLTTEPDHRATVMADAIARGQPEPGFEAVIAGNRWTKFRLVIQLFQVLFVVLRVRPDVVVTTGAAPGYWAIRFGKMLGAKTCWIDSIANAEELSLSGKKASRHSGLWLTQWEHLSGDDKDPDPDHPDYVGSVI